MSKKVSMGSLRTYLKNILKSLDCTKEVYERYDNVMAYNTDKYVLYHDAHTFKYIIDGIKITTETFQGNPMRHDVAFKMLKMCKELGVLNLTNDPKNPIYPELVHFKDALERTIKMLEQTVINLSRDMVL